MPLDINRANMTTINFLPAKERNNYFLETEETTVARSAAKPRLRGGFSLGKKIISGFVVAMIMALGLIGGLAANIGGGSTSQKSAVAEPSIFNFPSLFCIMKDDNGAYLGGSNDITKNSILNQQNAKASEGLLGISSGPQDKNGNPTGRWTALEQYGYFAPTYSSWNGAYIEPGDDGSWSYIGTGGGGTTTSYGKLVQVTNAKNSAMFSHSWSDCGGLGDSISVSIANAVSFLPKMFVAVSGELYGWASTVSLTQDGSPLKPIADGVSNMILGTDGHKGLKDVLFLDFLTPIVIIGTLGLIWTGIVKRSSIQAGQAAIWMIGASIAGLIFLSKPMLVPEIVDGLVGQVNSSVSDALLAGDNSTTLCNAAGGTTDGNSPSNITVRQMKCVIWYSAIYVPWVSGQFNMDQYSLDKYPQMFTDENTTNINGKKIATAGGDVPGDGFKKGFTGDDIKPMTDNQGGANSRNVLATANIKFGNTSYDGKVDWALYQLDRQSGNESGNRGIDYSEIAYNQLVVNNNSVWKGAGNALGASWLSLIAAIGPSLVILTISFTLLAYQVTMLVLIAFSPLLFLVGVAPGWGRRVAMRWLELIVGLLVKRIILMMFLLLFVKLYSLVIAQTSIGWFFQAVMVAVLSAVALTQRHRIMALFTDAINFGGDRHFGDDGATSQLLKQKTMTTALAATAGTRWAMRKAPGAAVKTAGATKKAAQTTSAGVKKTAAGVNKVKDKGHQRYMEKKGDEKIGIGSNKDISAHNWTNHENLNLERLNPTERNYMMNPDGTVNKDRAAIFLDTRKRTQARESAAINKKHQELKVEKQRIANLKKDKSKRDEAKQAEEQYRKDRDSLRVRQTNLNSEVFRLFGTPEGDGKGNPSFNGSRDFKSTAKKYRPKKLARQYQSRR